LLGVIVKLLRHTMIDDDGETNVFHGPAQLLCEPLLTLRTTRKPGLHVNDLNFRLFIVCIDAVIFRQAIALRLVDLFVALVILIQGLDTGVICLVH
jgi:hypothetical protein